MDADLAGRTLLGKLRVLEPLGAGGMGTVYDVEHLSGGRRCALKVLHAALADDAQAVARLLREAAIALTFHSPHVVSAFEVGYLEDGRVYLLMERLEGRSLKARLAESGPLPASEVARLGVQIGYGLAAAHAAGVVHRDLTPANVFLIGPRGAEHVKLLDFGLSKMLPGHTDRFGALTAAGTLLGTPKYMAPEQASGRPVDARADQYAMAVVLYECLVGEPPFRGDGLTHLLARIAEGAHVPLPERLPALDPVLCGAIERAMSVDPDARFATVAELTEILRHHGGRADALGPTQPVSGPGGAPQGPSRIVALPPSAPPNAVNSPSHPSTPSGTPSGPNAPSAPHPSAPHPSAPYPPQASTGSSAARVIAIALVAGLGGIVVLGGALLATRAFLLRSDAADGDAPSAPAATPAAAPGEMPLLPDDMRNYPQLQALHANHEYRECLDYAGTVPQTVHVLEIRVSCAANIQDWVQYRDACMALSRIDPANETVRYCMPALANIP